MDEAILIAFQHKAAKGCAGALRGRSHRYSGHYLDAAADGDIIGAANDALRGKVDGLLTRSTLAVNSGTWNGLRETGGKGCVTPDVEALLAHLHYATGDHIFD